MRYLFVDLDGKLHWHQITDNRRKFVDRDMRMYEKVNLELPIFIEGGDLDNPDIRFAIRNLFGTQLGRWK